MFRIVYWESEHGWGSKHFAVEYSDGEMAKSRFDKEIKEWDEETAINREKNHIPDYYIMPCELQESVDDKWKNVNGETTWFGGKLPAN